MEKDKKFWERWERKQREAKEVGPSPHLKDGPWNLSESGYTIIESALKSKAMDKVAKLYELNTLPDLAKGFVCVIE